MAMLLMQFVLFLATSIAYADRVMLTCAPNIVNINNNFTCRVESTFSACSNVAIKVDVDDGTSWVFENNRTGSNRLGIPVPRSLNLYNYTTASGYLYLLLNTEFLTDLNVTGFEFYLTTSGFVYFYISKFTSPSGTTIANKTETTGRYPTYVSSFFVDRLYGAIGYNYYELSKPRIYPKGSLVELRLLWANVAVNTRSPGKYNDYEYYRGLIGSDANNKKALFFNVITNQTITNPTITSNYIAKSFSTTGLYNITASFSCGGNTFWDSKSVTVIDDSQLCNKAVINLDGFSTSISQPTAVYKSNVFKASAKISLNCSLDFSLTKQWNINQVDQYGNFMNTVSLASNPSVSSTQLVLQANYLNYGFYSVTFRASINIRLTGNIFNTSTVVFIQMIPTGIVVNGLANRVQSIEIGSIQSILLQPNIYSYDLDYLVSSRALSFSYYCRFIDSGAYGNYSYFDNGTRIDLKTQQNKGLPYTDGCFSSSSQYQFDSVGSLKINSGGLAVVTDRVYEYYIETSNKGQLYGQSITISVKRTPVLPIVSLYCRFPKSCVSRGQYLRFNPDKEMMIDSQCIQGCDQSLKYKFNVYKNIGSSLYPSWVAYMDPDLIISTDFNLNVSSALFVVEPAVSIWKVEFQANDTSSNLIGSSSLLFVKNLLPVGGSCWVDLKNGTAMSTFFTITCTGWVDPDGQVIAYEYFATYVGNPSPLAINYNAAGKISLQLPPGISSNNYKLSLFVQIVDDSDGITVYQIITPVYVYPNTTYTASMMSDVLNQNPESLIFKTLSVGDLEDCGQVLVSFTAMLNSEAISSSNKSSSTVDSEGDKRSQVRDAIMNTISGIYPSDMSSAKVLATMISSTTGSVNEISTNSAKLAVDKAVDLLYVVQENVGKIPLRDVLVCAYGMLDAASSALTATSGKIFGKIPNLSEDLSMATESDILTQQKIQLLDDYQKTTDNVLSNLRTVVTSYMTANQSTTITTNTMSVTFTKKIEKAMNKSIRTESGGFKLPASFCQMYNESTDSNNCTSNSMITIQTSSKYMSIAGMNGDSEAHVGDSTQIGIVFTDENDNEIKIQSLKSPITVTINRVSSLTSSNDLSFKQISTASANSTNFAKNQMLTYSFSLSGSNVSLQVQLKPSSLAHKDGYLMFLKFGSEPIYNSSYSDYSYVKLFCASDLKKDGNDTFYQLFLNMSSVNGYKGQVGLGIRPLTSSEKSVYCPNNININGSIFLTNPPLVNDPTEISFNDTIAIRMITNGCYYFDSNSGEWKTDGVEVIESGTNTMQTQCETYHLTEFAGGFVVLPEPIDFSYVFANASLDKNPLIYATVIGISCLYIVLALWCLYMDKIDKSKTGICVLSDNYINLSPESSYFYELIVHTGMRKDAGTDSKVKFLLFGENGETDIRCLLNDDSSRKILRRGGVDSFIMATDKPLGNLTFLRIWHDNSGKGAMSSWFLKCVIVHDLQTRENFYFICQRWLAVEKDDGCIERLFPISCEKQKTEFKYLLEKQAKSKLSDGHLWLSVLTRPVQSSFTRLERLTCCVVMLYLSMLVNILYYDIKYDSSSSALKIGPFSLSPEQISIGIISNLIIFPTSFLLLQLFKKSRKRVSKSSRLRKIISRLEVNIEPEEQDFINVRPKNTREELFQSKPYPGAAKTKVKKPFTFPWWFKIIAYCLAFVISAVSIIFIIVKGITFGNETAGRWLTSLVVSILTSILLTQPIQIALVALFFVTLFRKHDEEAEFEGDVEDDGLPINSKYKHSSVKIDEETEAEASHVDVAKLDEDDLEDARVKRMKEVQIIKLIKEIVFYSMFIWILAIVAYTNKDVNSFNYQQQIRNFLSDNTFDNIKTPADMWEWVRDVFVPRMKLENTDSLCSIFADYSSYIISYPLMRQIRVQSNSCILLGRMKSSIDFCLADLSFFNEEKSDFEFNWASLGTGILAGDPKNSELSNVFKYTHASDIDSYPYSGIYNTYQGGGYVYKITGSKNSILSDMALLLSNNWIDRQTRAVFLEFSMYNPAINIFAYCTVLFEFLPNGVIQQSMRISPLNLYQFNSDFKSLIIACNLIYLGFVIFFMFREIKELIRLKWAYFKRFWSYIEWLIIGFSWAAFAMYLYRLNCVQNVSSLMQSYNSTSSSTIPFIRMQITSYWNDALGFCLAFCAALGSMKFLKLLRFNKRIAVFVDALKLLVMEFLNFLIIFMIFYLAFVQLMYLEFQSDIKGFSTFIGSMETSFEIMLGKFSVQPIMEASNVVGPLYFSLFNIVMVFMLLNIFLTMVTNAFDHARTGIKTRKDELDVVGFLIKEAKKLPFIPEKRLGNLHMNLESFTYQDPISYLPIQIEKLLQFTDRKQMQALNNEQYIKMIKVTKAFK